MFAILCSLFFTTDQRQVTDWFVKFSKGSSHLSPSSPSCIKQVRMYACSLVYFSVYFCYNFILMLVKSVGLSWVTLKATWLDLTLDHKLANAAVCAPDRRCVCTHQMAACSAWNTAILKVWRHSRHITHISNPTPSVDAYVLEEHPFQVLKFCRIVL